jgi:hypothetical protein
VKNRFQSLPFKCNLQRYNVLLNQAMKNRHWDKVQELIGGGLYQSNPVDP